MLSPYDYYGVPLLVWPLCFIVLLIDLPLIKTLYVSSVQFEDMKDFMNLVCGCPILEYLTTIGVESTIDITVGGCIKPLSKLMEVDICLFDVHFRVVQNVQSVSVYDI
jgi:hypothetical protein